VDVAHFLNESLATMSSEPYPEFDNCASAFYRQMDAIVAPVTKGAGIRNLRGTWVCRLWQMTEDLGMNRMIYGFDSFEGCQTQTQISTEATGMAHRTYVNLNRFNP
jgi:hypothetical protein